MPKPPTKKPPSAELAAFIAESLDRGPIFEFVRGAAMATPAGSRVLDAGSGTGPYRELFGHCDYVTTDWEQSIYEEARSADVVAPLEKLPLEDGAFDTVICTQVLEHLPEPAAVLRELRRVLSPGGRIWITAPLVWELHEEPYDFYRYTPYGLRHLLAAAEFTDIDVGPLAGYFLTLATLMSNAGWITFPPEGRAGLGNRIVTTVLHGLAPLVARLDRLDRRRVLPLTYGCTATRTG